VYWQGETNTESSSITRFSPIWLCFLRPGTVARLQCQNPYSSWSPTINWSIPIHHIRHAANNSNINVSRQGENIVTNFKNIFVNKVLLLQFHTFKTDGCYICTTHVTKTPLPWKCQSFPPNLHTLTTIWEICTISSVPFLSHHDMPPSAVALLLPSALTSLLPHNSLKQTIYSEHRQFLLHIRIMISWLFNWSIHPTMHLSRQRCFIHHWIKHT
jgi:hypothetical protein